jgi:transcriptional regulator with XRE-family HTH domain
MDVPKLSEKLDLLFKYDSFITSRSDLAGELGVEPSTITKWEKGSYEYTKNAGRVAGRPNLTREPNRIPDRHVQKFLSLFNLQLSWLKEADIKNFESWFLFISVPRTPWQTLLLHAEASEALKLKRSPGRKRATRLNYESNIELPTDKPLHPGERVYIELNLDDRWNRSTPEEALAYVIILWTAGLTIRCLCPSDSPVAPDYQLMTRRTLLPVNPEKNCLRVESIPGEHTIIALITGRPFADSNYEELKREKLTDSSPVLNTLAQSLLIRPKETWQCLKSDFLVQPKNMD